MPRCVKLSACLIAIIIASTGPAASQSNLLQYKDSAISFLYPSDWVISVQKGKPEIRLKPKNWNVQEHINEFAIYMSVEKEPFEKAAISAGFVRKGEGWILEGRHGIGEEAEEIKSKNWTGLMGEAPVGTSQGLAYATTIIITNGKISAVLTGEELFSKEGEAIMNSVEFEPAGK